MNLFKLIGILLFTISGSLTALNKYFRHKERIAALSEFLKLLTFMKSEIEYSAPGISDLLRSSKNSISEEIIHAIDEDMNREDTFREVGEKIFSGEEERISFIEFWDSFGKSDRLAQCSLLEQRIEKTNVMLRFLKSETKSKVKAEIALCMFITASADILLI